MGSMEKFGENIPKTETETDREKLGAFYQSFENCEIVTSEGKTVRMHIRNSEGCHVLEFEGYPGEDVKHQKDWKLSGPARFLRSIINPKKDENFVLLRDGIKGKIIDLEVVIENASLKGKNVFPQVRKLIADNFPQGYTLESRLHNKKKYAELCEIWRKIVDKELTIEEAIKILQSDKVVQWWFGAGFTDIRMEFDDFIMPQIYLFRQKNEGQEPNFVLQIGEKVY
jgi:hypothetical protein